MPKEWETEVGEEFRPTSVQGARGWGRDCAGAETCLRGPELPCNGVGFLVQHVGRP